MESKMFTVQRNQKPLPWLLAVLFGSLIVPKVHAQIQTGPFTMTGQSSIGFAETASSSAPITKVYAGSYITVGQRSDGTFVLWGSNANHLCLLPAVQMSRQISIGASRMGTTIHRTLVVTH